MKKRIIIGIILTLIFAASWGVIYLNNVYLPVKVKGQIASALSTYLNYNVEIEKLKYSPIRGAVIQNIIIYDKVKDKDNTILTIKEASFQFLFLPLIKERKIIIPIIHIDSPYLNIRYQKDNTFNFSRAFLPNPNLQKKPKIKYSFLVYKINVFNGKGVFEDARQEPKFTKNILYLDIVIGVRQLTKAGFLIDAKILADKGGITTLSVKGIYNFLSKELNSKITLANLVITEYNPYLKNMPAALSAGIIDNGSLEVKLKNNNVNLKGIISVKGLGASKENIGITGDMDIEPELNYSLDAKIMDYKANFKFIRADLSGIKNLDKITNISGSMGLAKNKLWTDGLKFHALDSNFVLKGTLDSSTSPYIKLNFKSEQINLEKAFHVLTFASPNTSLTGTATADISLEGFIGRPPPFDIRAALKLNNAKLQTAFLKDPISNINGRADFTRDTASWSGLSFNYLNTAYMSTGKLVDFNAPQITFGLTSNDLNMKTDIKIKDKSVRIITLAGKYLNSKFDVEGAVDTQDKDNPGLNLTLNEINLVPADIYHFLPASLSESLKKTKLNGILNIKGILNGRAKDYKSWKISLKAGSKAFSVYGLKFGGLNLNVDQKNGVIYINRLTASGYSGFINVNFNANLTPDIPIYLLKFNGSGINLAELKLDTGLKDKDMAGLLNINADLRGNFKDPASLKGEGFISIKDGKLWQLNLLKGLGEFFLLPDYEKVVFKEALGAFDIENKSVSTENLRLASDQLNLHCKGKLGFDGALDFTLYTEVNQNLINDSPDIRKFTTAILGNLSDALTIKLSGTIQQPKYKVVPVATDLIKNITDFILGK